MIKTLTLICFGFWLALFPLRNPDRRRRNSYCRSRWGRSTWSCQGIYYKTYMKSHQYLFMPPELKYCFFKILPNYTIITTHLKHYWLQPPLIPLLRHSYYFLGHPVHLTVLSFLLPSFFFWLFELVLSKLSPQRVVPLRQQWD